jgi:transcriptional regulator with XRE-family HTH domain
MVESLEMPAFPHRGRRRERRLRNRHRRHVGKQPFDLQSLGFRLEMLMRERGISAVELQRQTGIPDSTVGDWVNRRTQPRGDQLVVLCDFFGVSADWLLCRTDTRCTMPSPGIHLGSNKTISDAMIGKIEDDRVYSWPVPADVRLVTAQELGALRAKMQGETDVRAAETGTHASDTGRKHRRRKA